MGRKTESTQQQASAGEMSAAEQRAAGMGGSYVIDPRTGATELAHRTEAATVSRKEGLKKEDATGALVPADEAGDASSAAADSSLGSAA